MVANISSQRGVVFAVFATNEVTRCPHCGAHSLHRHGTTPGGTQRFLCRRCRRTSTCFTGSVVAHIRKRTEFRQFAATMHRALPTRKEAQRLGVAPSTVWRWRRSLMERMAKRRAHQRRRWRGNAVSVPHFMGEQRRFWGRIDEYFWLERRGLHRRKPFGYLWGEPGTIVHFLVGERLNLRTLDEVAIEIGDGCLKQPRVPKRFEGVLAPKNIFWLFRNTWLAPIAYRATSQSEYTYITGPPKRFAPRDVPPPLKRIPMETLPASTQRAAWRAQDLCSLFCKWAERFRGISLKYFDGYVAWFLEDMSSNRLPYFWVYPGRPRWWEERGRTVERVHG